MEFLTNNASQTQAVAKQILDTVDSADQALVLALEGDLGSGKTTFTQGLAKELGIVEPILSPTFVIMKRYEIAGRESQISNRKFRNLYHIDAYRLEGFNDMESILEKETFRDPECIIVIEWAEQIKDILPKNAIWIKFEHLGEDRRRIKIQDL